MDKIKIDSVTKVAKPKKIKEPIVQKKALMSNNKLKSTLTIKPQEEVIKEVESVTEILTPFIPEFDIPEPLLDMPIVDIPERRFEVAEKEAKLAQEKRFAKIALCIGIVFLVLMIFNKK